MRICLAQAKRDGRPDFMAVWTHALHSLPRGTTEEVVRERREWMALLKWARPAFQAAYEDVPLDEFLAPAERELLAA